MDSASLLMIVVAGAALLSRRLLLAALSTHRTRAALQQHHTRPPSSMWASIASKAAAVPSRVRMGLALGAASAFVGLAPLALPMDGPVMRALWLACKWALIGTLIRAVRTRWGVRRPARGE